MTRSKKDGKIRISITSNKNESSSEAIFTKHSAGSDNYEPLDPALEDGIMRMMNQFMNITADPEKTINYLKRV